MFKILLAVLGYVAIVKSPVITARGEALKLAVNTAKREIVRMNTILPTMFVEMDYMVSAIDCFVLKPHLKIDHRNHTLPQPILQRATVMKERKVVIRFFMPHGILK
jgi:hypothetical protein